MEGRIYLTPRDIAAELGISEADARHWVAQMPAIRVGRDLVVQRHQLEEWLRTRTRAA